MVVIVAMTEIVILTAADRRTLAEALNHADNRDMAVRICMDDGTVKVKVHRGVWSPPLGALDPECEVARDQDECHHRAPCARIECQVGDGA